jgi:hypothetical protein
MRLRLAAAVLVLFAVPLPAVAAPAFKASFTALTHTPKVNAKWYYTVRATDSKGGPIRATLTSELVDPYGGVHAVEFGCCKRNVTNHPFRGVFRDYVQYPPGSQGFRLVFRATVKALGGKRVLTYWVKAR